MKTYISITPEVETKLVLDGNTGNPKIDELLPKLYKKFSIFEIKINTDYKHADGFVLFIKTHDNFQRLVFGTIAVEYMRLTYQNPTGEDHYSIRGGRSNKHDFERQIPIVAGYISTGRVFDEVLEDFLAGTVELLEKRIKFYEDQKKWATKLLNNPKRKTQNFFEPGEA